MLKTKRNKQNWGVCDLKILLWLVSQYCIKENVDFI